MEQNFEKIQRNLLEQNSGLLTIKLKIPIYDRSTLALVYTPGVGEVCSRIQKDSDKANYYTNIKNSLIVLTDGTGYNNPKHQKLSNEALIPQIEAQSVYYKNYQNIDAYPFILDSQHIKDENDFVQSLISLQGSFRAVELYKVCLQKHSNLVSIIEQRKSELNLVILTNQVRSDLNNAINNIKTVNALIALIFRVAIDVNFIGLISNDLTNLLLQNKDLLVFSESWTWETKVYETIAKYFFDNQLTLGFKSLQVILDNHSQDLIQGKKFYVDNNTTVDLNQEVKEQSVQLHQKYKGVIKTGSKIKPRLLSQLFQQNDAFYQKLEDEIMGNSQIATQITLKGNWCAIITNGTAILGLGDIGATAGLPVMEGKSTIFKQLGGVDVVPICIQEKDPKKFIDEVMKIAPIFSAINLEDIKAPQCFEIEDTLKEKLDYPVFHDDQHGTAIVTGAAVTNAIKLMGKKPEDIKLIINGGGAAGLSITRLLLDLGIKNIIICDTKGSIYTGRPINMNKQKDQLAAMTNPNNFQGSLEDALEGADIFVGVSAPGALKSEWIAKMSDKILILAMANPIPEILPEEAKKAAADAKKSLLIMGTGRSDFPNQVNNSLVFPGIFRGALDVQARNITNEMKLAATYAIANLIQESELNPDLIIPAALDSRVPIVVAKAVGLKAIEQGITKKKLTEQQLEHNITNFLLQRQLLNLN